MTLEPEDIPQMSSMARLLCEIAFFFFFANVSKELFLQALTTRIFIQKNAYHQFTDLVTWNILIFIIEFLYKNISYFIVSGTSRKWMSQAYWFKNTSMAQENKD